MAEIKQLNTRIQLRNDTAANWESANPILLKGEVGVVLGAAGEKARFKIGDGTTAWNDLEFSDGSKFTWQGKHTMGLPGKGVDEVIEMTINVVPSTDIAFSQGI